jgi:putative ABC transport system permease protein
VVTYRHSMAREKGASFVHRYYIDVLLLVLGGLGYRMLSSNNTIITRNAAGGLQIDPLVLLTPIVLVTGLAFLALRVIPLLFRVFARLVSLGDSVSGLFALRQIARTTTRYSGLILILTFTLAIGLFTTSVANAFDRNYGDQAMFAAGADLREQELDYKTVTWVVRPLQEYQQMPGVVGVAPVLRVNLVGRDAGVIAKGVLLAVDPASFARVAWWRQDFTPSLQQITALLAADPQAIVADKNFAGRHGLKIGQKFDIDVNGKRVDFVLAGTLGYFPTLYPADGDQLVANLDYVQKMSGDRTSEVWLDTRPAQHAQVAAALRKRGDQNTVSIEDGHTLIGVRKDDPLRTGLFGALSLGFIASCVLSILGFLLYAYMSIQSRSLQFGVLRATGLSVNQLVKALSSEQLSLIGIGIFLGTVLGGGAGWLFTRFLQLSIIARESVPPFLVTVPWAAIAELYIILVIIFGIALSASVYLLRQMRIASVLRLGEQ